MKKFNFILNNSHSFLKTIFTLFVLSCWSVLSFAADEVTATDKLPPATRTYKELPAKIEETISLGVLEQRGEYRWYAAYVLTDGTVVSSSEPLVFVVE